MNDFTKNKICYRNYPFPQFAVLPTYDDYFMAQKELFYFTKTRKIPKKIVIVELMWKRDYKHKNVNSTHQYYFFALPIDNAILPKYYYVIISLQKLHASTCTPVSCIYKRRLYKIINHEAVTFVFFEKNKKDTTVK